MSARAAVGHRVARVVIDQPAATTRRRNSGQMPHTNRDGWNGHTSVMVR